MISALTSGVSGLQNHQARLNVIGNNIANINTIGFKSSRTTFKELLSQTVSGARSPQEGLGGTNPVQFGLGSAIGSIDSIITQGSLTATGLTTDVAIQGDGFFILSNGAETFYTRTGAFTFDANGTLINPSNGFIVQGRLADEQGIVTPTPTVEDLTISFGKVSPPKSTTAVNFRGNLNANSDPREAVWTGNLGTDTLTGAPSTGATLINDLSITNIDLSDGDVINIVGTKADGSSAAGTFTFDSTTASTVGDLLTAINTAFDSAAADGSTAVLDASGNIVLTDNATGKSSTSINLVLGSLSAGSTGNITFPTFTNTVVGRAAGIHSTSISIFDSLGEAHTVTVDYTATDTPGEWTWEATLAGSETIFGGNTGSISFTPSGSLRAFLYDGAGVSSFSFDPGNGASPVNLNFNVGSVGPFDGITQLTGTSTAAAKEQDGFGIGKLTSASIQPDGTIVGVFTNGQINDLGRIILSDFTNPGGLERVGDSLYQVSANSGLSVLGIAGESIQATINSGFLESSNVDLTREFADLIIAQRGFQANARVITTSDDILNEIVNLKR